MTGIGRFVVFLSGPIGSGKTTLGRCLGARSLAGFVDGDDHHVPGRPWFSSTLGTSRSILNAVIVALQNHDIVVVAYPLRCVNWIYYRRHLAAAGIASVFVGLSATLEEITHRDRGRLLSEAEQARLSVMLAEGYSNRLFYDVQIKTGGRSLEATLAEIDLEIAHFLSSRC
ncbi:MAG: hypothetical protein NTW00_10410 [Hyphomicrobiales bacterium]|nr:hypothetical protein [Hyphomicrobiales bacterium]